MRPILLILPLISACSSGGGPDGTYASTGAGDDKGTSSTSTPIDGDTGLDPLVPIWWTVQGEFSLTGGVVDPLLSNVKINVLDVDLGAVCVSDAAPLSVDDSQIPATDLVTWWTLTLSPAELCPAAPTTISIGFGPYDSLIDPGAAATGIDTTTINGLYTTSGEDLWVFGVSGTPAQFAGKGVVLETAPLADGIWRFTGLYLLPL